MKNIIQNRIIIKTFDEITDIKFNKKIEVFLNFYFF